MAFGDITPTSGESNGKEHGKSNEPRFLHLNSITETTPSAKAFRVPSALSAAAFCWISGCSTKRLRRLITAEVPAHALFG